MISNDNNGVKTISSESGILDLIAFSTFTSTHTPITAASTPPLPALKMASSGEASLYRPTAAEIVLI